MGSVVRALPDGHPDPRGPRLARQRAGLLKVVKVNVDDSPGIAALYQVQGIPTLLLFNDGKVTARQTRALPAHALTEWLDADAPATA